MNTDFNIQRLLVLRKLTRAVAETLREQLTDYLSTLAPLLRPKTTLGDFIHTSVKESARGADRAFRDLQALYEQIAPQKPFNLAKPLQPPIDIVSSTMELLPVSYLYDAQTETESKQLTVTQPLRWLLHYSGYAPERLRELLRDRNRSAELLQEFIIHYFVIHSVMTKQTGVTAILERLHFTVSADKIPEFGGLPLVYISSAVSTVRPPDSVIVESTEISGMPVFEEIINTDDIMQMRDTLKERLIEIVSQNKQPA